MVKREDAFAEALSRKREILAEKERVYDRRRTAAYEANDRLPAIDRELAASGAQIALTALSGDSAALRELQKEIALLSAEREELLQKAGVAELVFDCPLCRDTGYVGGKLCDCVKTMAKQITARKLNEEMPLDDCRFDNFDLNYYPNTDTKKGNPHKRMTGVLKLCREYVLNFDPATAQNLLFIGDTGLGKTHLTLAIVAALVDRGFNVIYGSAYNLFSAIEQEHFSGQNGDSYDALLACDLLVLDDLGTEFVTPFVQSVFYNVINSRLLAKKPTVINTNLSMSQIEKRYTARVSSRLIGTYTARQFIGADIRQIKALEKH